MQLSPRHDGVPVLLDLADPHELASLLNGQRRRFAGILAALGDDGWASASRCAGWTVRDVAGHLLTVDGYWAASVRAGLAGAPLRMLRAFDPATTPPALLRSLDGLGHDELYGRLAAAHVALDEATSAIGDDQWARPAETPLGHVGLAELAAHALWDAWVHERDVTVPLGIAGVPDAREVARSLRFVAGLAAALTVLHDLGPTDTLALECTDTGASFAVEVREVDGFAQVVVRDVDGGATPCLRGPAVELLEALSLRAPLPDDAPDAWTARVGSLAAALGTG